MKKILLLAILIGASFCSLSQTLYVPNGTSGISTSTVSGNVGIGTSVPQAKLQVMETSAGMAPNGSTINTGIFISGNGTAGSLNMGIDGTGSTSPIFYSWIQSRSRDTQNYWPLALNPFGGNVGTGTYAPELASHIVGASGFPVTSGASQVGVLRLQGNGSNGVLDFSINGGSGASLQVANRSNLSLSYSLLLNPNGGNVGIGTASTDAKLTVKGAIHAQEVKVDLNGAIAPDYVFAPTYNLPSLDSVQSYIKQNKHLPEVPSAKEMEVNGINVGEMNMLLLKKVEELTLYVIEQQKQLKIQTERSESQIKALTMKLEAIAETKD